MTFGEWLRKKIAEQDISNAEVARRVGVSPTYIGNLVRDFSPSKKKPGGSRPSEEVIERIAGALDSPVDEARTAAGYVPLDNSDVAAAISARVALLEKNLTKEEQAEVILEIGFAVDVLMRRIEERRKKDA